MSPPGAASRGRASAQSGTLWLVGTPIGNLEDTSARALAVLRAVDLIACEDTRRTRGLLSHFGISARTAALPAFDEDRRSGALVERLLAGDDVAVVTDAGMPGISDPGAIVVRRAVEAGIRVVPVPGPSAPLAALAASGLPTERFTFAGFLPRKGGGRQAALEELARAPGTLVLFESPRRLRRTLADLTLALGDRRACVARELTKLHEELTRGRLSELEQLHAGEVRGEVTIVVEGAAAPAPVAPDPERRLEALLEDGASVKDAARQVAEELGLPKRKVYQRALALAAGGDDEGER